MNNRNLPPGPRTSSQEIAAQLPTMPAPKDPRIEPESGPELEEALEYLKSDAPKADKVGVIHAIAARLKLESHTNQEQDKTLAALAERMGRLEGATAAQSATIGGYAAKVVEEAPPLQLTPAESLPEAPAPKAPESPTLVSRLEEITKLSGKARLGLIAVLVIEGLDKGWPIIKAAAALIAKALQ